jgi:hypothetical protein
LSLIPNFTLAAANVLGAAGSCLDDDRIAAVAGFLSGLLIVICHAF